MHLRLHRPNRSEVAAGAVSAALGATAGFIAARTSRKPRPAVETAPDDAAWHLALRSTHPPRR
jgi:hypothetical protein